MRFIAKTFAGIERVLADELQQLGANSIKILRRGVSFEGDQKLLYRANIELHTALRILIPIDDFVAPNEQVFYKKVQAIDWSTYFNNEETFAINALAFSKVYKHSHYVALKTKDAIVDQFRDRTGKRPNVDVQRPKVRIHVYINGTDCSIALDSSGDSLHKRGYRIDTVEAPINEVLAAGLIGLTEWDKDTDFIDPMCGSGTFLTEAALWAFNTAPNLHRKSFGFTKWNDFNPQLFKEVKAHAKALERGFDYNIYGFDKSFKAIKATQRNILAAQLEGKITVERMRFEKSHKIVDNGLIIMNPPYDERLNEININELYRKIGDQLKQEYAGYNAWIISSNRSALKQIGLRPSKKFTIFNGQLECKFQRYDLYEGSKKNKQSLPNDSHHSS